MSTKPYTRRRPWLSLFLLLAFVAALLPTQPAAAQPEEIEIGLEGLKDQLFRRWYENQVQGQGVSEVIRVILVEERLDISLGVEAETVIAEAAKLQERYIKRLGPRGADPAYRASLPPNVQAVNMYAAAIETPYFKDEAKSAYGEVRDNLANSEDPAVRSVVTAGDPLKDAYRKLQQERTAKNLDRAKTDKKFAEKVKAVHENIAGANSATFDVNKYVDSPEAGAPQPVREAIHNNAPLKISLAELETLAKEEFAKINSSIDDMQKTLVTLSAQQGELVDFMRDQQARQQAQAIAEAKAREHQLKLDAASSAVSIVSTLVGLKYPQRGKQIAVFGSSAIKIAQAFHGWMQATAGLNTLSKVGSLSTVVMTGNVLGAVMNIVSLFGPQQPSPEQLILDEIGKLRQQVNELRTEMHDRFDQVDKQLNAIYSALNERFNRIDIQLGKISGSIDELQQSLYSLSLALDRLERNNTEYLDALGRRPLREAFNGALGYKQRTGVDMPYQPDFVAYENTFHAWGTITAFDPLSAGPSQRDYSDAAVLAELSAAPLDANLNYLNGWLLAHGLPPFASKRLPSPRDWAFASRAYAALGLDWPEHLRRISGERQAALDAVGKDLQLALDSIATLQTPDGPQGNGPLFTALLDYYAAKLDGLDQALVQSEAAFVADVQNDLQRSAPFDLYGGLDQPLASPPTDFTTLGCGGLDAPQARLAAPRYLKNIVPAYQRFALADYLGLSPLKVCAFADWTRVDPPCPPATCNRYGDYRVFIIVYSGGVQIARRDLTDRELYVPDIWSQVLPEWDRYWKGQFELLFLNQGAPPAPTAEAARQLELVSGKLVARLSELQRAHAGRVLSEQTRGTLQARGVELAGARKLLESFITLGLPRALGSDDLLRSLLLSDEALVDNQQVGLAYTAALSPTLGATQTITEERLLVNPRLELRALGEKRREALSGLLGDYLGGLSTESYREDNALVSGARFDMLIARVIADPNAPLPDQTWTVFLPTVQRQ